MSLNPSERSELFGTDTNVRVGSLAAISSRTAGSRRFPQFGGTLKSEVRSLLVMLLETIMHDQNKKGVASVLLPALESSPLYEHK